MEEKGLFPGTQTEECQNHQHLARGGMDVKVTIEEQLGSSWRDAKLSFEFIGKSY